jgi:hypothetical protein
VSDFISFFFLASWMMVLESGLLWETETYLNRNLVFDATYLCFSPQSDSTYGYRSELFFGYLLLAFKGSRLSMVRYSVHLAGSYFPLSLGLLLLSLFAIV